MSSADAAELLLDTLSDDELEAGGHSMCDVDEDLFDGEGDESYRSVMSDVESGEDSDLSEGGRLDDDHAERPLVAGCYLGQRRNTGDTVANVCVSISELLVDVSCAMSHRFWTLGVLALQLAVAAVNAASAVEILSQVPSCASECISSTFITSACDPEDVTACICLDIAVQSELSTSAATVEGALCEGYPKASRRTEVRRTLIISCSLVLFVVTLRLFTSKQYAGGLWRDDYMTILAAALLIALAAVYLHITSIGFGMHYWTIPVGNGVVIRKVR
ncbi:integral membrane protein [Colletotrichum abscissum]|uniref:uncharacterized protein n=1 Tax=Colletotrichum abscissum TaxID=1671311 RepID=UPI0027D73E44|nr:uncharacterized protein CABS01_17131 [Colletotrichum abscissum]KAK1490788.1 integral membrane protein [Colletotrichum abscissum]